MRAKRKQKQRTRRYRSLSSFYGADERRLHSQELDVGLWWREDADGPLHRAAWVTDTGELYVVRLGPAEEGGGSVEVLADVQDRDGLERSFQGWREQVGEPRSLTWLRDRAVRARAATRVSRGPRPSLRASAGSV